MTTNNTNMEKDERVIINNEQGFEVRFDIQKLGAYVALAFAFGLFIIDYMMYLYIGEYFMKIAIFFAIYLAIHSLFSKYIVKLSPDKLSSFSAPIPRIFANKSILRNDIEKFYVKKTTSTTRTTNSNMPVKQTHYNLIIKTKDGKEKSFFQSLSSNETYLLEKLMKEKILVN